MSTIRLGTRGSALARWQTDHVLARLRAASPEHRYEVVVIASRGDRDLASSLPLIGGKGLFTAELEAALHAREIDLAVHSLKDLPVDVPDGLAVGAIPPRASAADAVVSRHDRTLADLPAGATVGTSSPRRAGQLLHLRPDLRVADIRGNVETRIRKVRDGRDGCDATLLACAGLERLGLRSAASEILPLEAMLPAPGQGALAVQCRRADRVLRLLRAIHDPTTCAAVEAERAFLRALGGGCAVPVGALAVVAGGQLALRGRVTAPDGSEQIDVARRVPCDPAGPAAGELARECGEALAGEAADRGAAALLGAGWRPAPDGSAVGAA